MFSLSPTCFNYLSRHDTKPTKKKQEKKERKEKKNKLTVKTFFLMNVLFYLMLDLEQDQKIFFFHFNGTMR